MRKPIVDQADGFQFIQPKEDAMKRHTRSVSTRTFLLTLGLLISLSFSPSAFAVSEAAVLSLLISPSPAANAMGQTYANTVDASPMAALMNPASLGMFARKNILGTEYYPEKVQWLPSLNTITGMNLNARSTAFGVNLMPFLRIPVSIGLGFHTFRFNMGTLYATGPDSPEPIGTYEVWEEYKATTFSVALDYFIRLSLGYSNKSIQSVMAPDVEVKPKAHDFGVIAQIPVFSILERNENIRNMNCFRIIKPFLDPGFYYSKTNIGGKVWYIDPNRTDPLPRNLSLGISLSAGLVYKTEKSGFTLFSFKWAREVEDLLVRKLPGRPFEYVSGLHDIRFFRDVIWGKANDKVITKHGYELGFYDFYFVRKGRYEDVEGNVVYDTEGYGINYLQPIKILSCLLRLDDHFLVRLLSNVSFEKNYSKYGLGSGLFNTQFTSYVIRLSNFPLN
jgi:hypothetical protein